MQSRQQIGRLAREQCTLAFPQLRTEFEDGITRRQRVEFGQAAQEIERQPAAAGTQLQDLAPGLPQHLGRLAGQAAAEQRREFRGGDEIPGGAELLRPRAVITQTGGIERQLHVTGEIEPAAGRLDRPGDVPAQGLAVGEGFGAGTRQG